MILRFAMRGLINEKCWRNRYQKDKLEVDPVFSLTLRILCNTSSFKDAQSVGVLAAMLIARRRKMKELTIMVEDTKVRRQVLMQSEESGNK
ncbi:hypothetical protein MKW92_033673 [Papaver armeniacum]|nr:hypothetical protein MKW92_033673 [Papaver armeniacum]